MSFSDVSEAPLTVEEQKSGSSNALPAVIPQPQVANEPVTVE